MVGEAALFGGISSVIAITHLRTALQTLTDRRVAEIGFGSTLLAWTSFGYSLARLFHGMYKDVGWLRLRMVEVASKMSAALPLRVCPTTSTISCTTASLTFSGCAGASRMRIRLSTRLVRRSLNRAMC